MNRRSTALEAAGRTLGQLMARGAARLGHYAFFEIRGVALT